MESVSEIVKYAPELLRSWPLHMISITAENSFRIELFRPDEYPKIKRLEYNHASHLTPIHRALSWLIMDHHFSPFYFSDNLHTLARTW
jgi:hypothetical protein